MCVLIVHYVRALQYIQENPNTRSDLCTPSDSYYLSLLTNMDVPTTKMCIDTSILGTINMNRRE
jgi:hypothetical protein